jgi:hypothetical protein
MNIDISIHKSVGVAISGGEGWVDDHHYDDYCIQIGGISISGMQGEDLARLVVEAYNHLDLNGHRFRMIPTSSQDQPEVLTYRGTT